MARNILVVDDNKVNRLILHKMLSAEYGVIEAENGQEAIDILYSEHQRIAAVLLDIIMPVMDGYGVLEIMEADPTLSQIPVIVTTGNTEAETEKKALALGANDFVNKPFNAGILKHRMENLIKLRETAAMVNTLQKDRLTGVWNRESFFEKAEQQITKMPGGSLVLGCIDIDNFKLINDRFGMEKGDEVLKCLARALEESCEKNGGICGRITADNFISLFPIELAERGVIGPEILEQSIKNEMSMPVMLSVGRYIVEDKSLSISAMYDRAKLARDTIKGRYDAHVAVYSEAMRERLVREQEIINGMDTALSDGQFETWYQPQYNHSTGALIGAEALVRWRHPEWGIVAPAEFISVFERNGFVYELDKYVWEHVCACLRRWKNEGVDPLPVSVNISRYDVLRSDVTDVILELTEKYGISPDMLRLEITESAFAESNEQVVNTVKRFIELGFSVEIDDFGSGYSSLNTLKDVPAQILKLDMRFMESSDDSARGGNILESIVRMAKWIGMSVIAEGVEKIEQADFLLSIGCSYIQGYLYARPMPETEYEALMRSAGKEERLIALETVANLDNNAFWEPESLDTLIFNSYAGAACIFEYTKGRIELIRLSKKYAKRFIFTGMTVEKALAIKWEEHLDAVYKSAVAEALRRSIEMRDEVACEVMFADLPSSTEKVYMLFHLRVIATAGDRWLVYGMYEDITEQREAELRVFDTNEQLRFLNEVAHDLLAQPEIDSGINNVLNKIMGHFGADRAYIIESDEKLQLSYNTYEACAPGVTSEMANLQAVPISSFVFWFSAFENGEYINIENVSAMPESRVTERAILEAQSIHSLISVPFNRDGRLIGFIGVDNPTKNQEHAEQLGALGDYLAVMLTRRDLSAKIENDKKTVLTLMDDTPGGFVRMRVFPDGHSAPVYANAGFCRIVGMTYEDILEKYAASSLWGVHPDDIGIVEKAVSEMLTTGETHGAKYRLLHGNGEYIWVRIFGRMTRDDSEDAFFNVYYTEISVQEKKDMTDREMFSMALLSIMSESPNLAFVKDVELKYVFCTHQIAEIHKRASIEEIIGKTDSELIGPEAAKEYIRTDRYVIENGTALQNLQIELPTDDGSVRHALASKYPLRDSTGKVIGIYGIGRDVTEERMNYAQLRLLTDSIPGGIATYALSPEGMKITYCNEGFCRLFGSTREQYAEYSEKNGVVSLVFPEDLPYLTEQTEKLRRYGTPIDCIYRCHKLDEGETIWINLRGVLAERVGEVCYMHTVLYDVTREKTMVESLRIHEEELKIAMSQMGKMICEYDIKTKTLTMPDDLAKRYGAGSVISNVPDIIIPAGFIDAEYLPAYKEFYDAIKRGDRHGEIEYHGKWKDGEPHWIRMEFSNVFDAAGRPMKAVIAVEDTTGRHDESRNAVLDRERMYTALVNLIPLVISVNLTRNSYHMISYNAYTENAAPQEGMYDALIDYGVSSVPALDKRKFEDAFSRDSLLKAFHEGKRKVELEHRQTGFDGRELWMLTQVFRVENPYDSDVRGDDIPRHNRAEEGRGAASEDIRPDHRKYARLRRKVDVQGRRRAAFRRKQQVPRLYAHTSRGGLRKVHSIPYRAGGEAKAHSKSVRKGEKQRTLKLYRPCA